MLKIRWYEVKEYTVFYYVYFSALCYNNMLFKSDSYNS